MPLGAAFHSLNLANPVAVSWPINRYGGEIQVTGSAVLNTTNKKFGTASGDFTSGGYITYKQFNASAFAIGGNYTIEFWIMLPGVVTGQKSLFTVSGGGSVSLRPQGSNVYDIEYTFEGENWNTNGGTAMTFTYGTWYHCAIVRYTTGPTTNIFFNGNRRSNRVATHTYPFTSGTSVDLLINGGQNLIYLDEIRFTNTSVYANAATYTIPTAAFTDSSSTKLLMHMDGTNGSNQFEDDDSAPPALTSVNKVAHKTQVSSSSANFVIPTTADVGYDDIMAGDVAVLFDTSTTTTDTTPSGWTSISKATTTGIRTNISYKILGSGDLGATISGMGGVNRKIMIIYRGGNQTIVSATPTVIAEQGTTGTPTNQTLVGEEGPMVALASYAKTSSTTPTRGWSVGSPTEYTSVSTSGIYVKELITNSGTPSTTTISMTDAGSNTLQSFRIKFA